MSSACGALRILMPALLTRMSIRPSSRTVRSTMVATADLSVTSAVTDMALTPRCLRSATAAFDFASLRPTIATAAPDSASPHAIPRPMPPLPPVTIATLPLRSKSPVFMIVIQIVFADGVWPRRERARLALALPDQDQADRGQRGAVSGPLDLADHEARLRPFDRAGTLADPEQPYGKCKKADDQEPVAHGVLPCPPSSIPAGTNDAARVARSFTAGKGAGDYARELDNNIIRSRKAQKSPGRCRGF